MNLVSQNFQRVFIQQRERERQTDTHIKKEARPEVYHNLNMVSQNFL